MAPIKSDSLGTQPRCSDSCRNSASGLGTTVKSVQHATVSRLGQTEFKPSSSHSDPTRPNDTHSFKQERRETGISTVENSVNPALPRQDSRVNELDECIDFLSLPCQQRKQVPHPLHSGNPQEQENIKNLQEFWDYATTSPRGSRSPLAEFIGEKKDQGPDTPDIVNDDAETFIRKAGGTKESEDKLFRAQANKGLEGCSLIDAALELALERRSLPATVKILEGLQLVKDSNELNQEVLNEPTHGTLLRRRVFQGGAISGVS